MVAARAVFHSSESAEWYTPAPIVEAARQVMGRIDLDPASNPIANKTVGALRFYDRDEDGLSQPWQGRVWLNPPYGRGEGNRSNMALWSKRLISEYDHGRVTQACLLVKAAPSERWFQRLYRFPICFTRGRVACLDVRGVPIRGNAHGTATAGIGVDLRRFVQSFSPIGTVVHKAEC